jgi:outer membrane lipoprotein-sorting protein
VERNSVRIMVEGHSTTTRPCINRRAGLVFVCLLACLAWAYVVVAEQGAAAKTDPKVEAFLEEFVAKREKLDDYSARFTQTKVSTLFDEREVSKGTVYYLRPGRIMWDYRSPDVMKVLVKDRVLSIYIEELEQLEIYDFTKEKKMRGLFLGFDESPDELKAMYDITLVDPGKGESGTCVQLVPKTEDLLNYFASVKIWLRPKDFAIYRILIVDPEEEGHTDIQLSRISVNRGVSADLFEIKVPEGTETIRQPIGEEEFEETTLSSDQAPR